MEAPTSRPGSCRSNPLRTAMKPACGPPNHSGTPNRWLDPTATSAPISPGGLSSVSASGSAASATSAPRSWAASTRPVRSRMAPLDPGYCASTPNSGASGRPSDRSATSTSTPSGWALARTTSMVCGWQSASITKAPSLWAARWHSAIASAAAVDSSSSEALAMSSPVRSLTIVWKLSSASSLPWEISGWYTSYTPYPPEISQGRLEALLNFQTMVSDLTGLDIANASLLDEPTAAAEAMALCHRAAHKDGAFVIDADCHPQTIEVVRARAQPLGVEVLVADLSEGLPDAPLFGVLAQYPGSSGAIRDLTGLV